MPRKESDTKRFGKTTEHFHVIRKHAINIAKKSKMHVDFASLNMKKDHLLFLIGKEYVSLTQHENPSAKLMKFMGEYQEVLREQELLSEKMDKRNK